MMSEHNPGSDKTGKPRDRYEMVNLARSMKFRTISSLYENCPGLFEGFSPEDVKNGIPIEKLYQKNMDELHLFFPQNNGRIGRIYNEMLGAEIIEAQRNSPDGLLTWGEQWICHLSARSRIEYKLGEEYERRSSLMDTLSHYGKLGLSVVAAVGILMCIKNPFIEYLEGHLPRKQSTVAVENYDVTGQNRGMDDQTDSGCEKTRTWSHIFKSGETPSAVISSELGSGTLRYMDEILEYSKIKDPRKIKPGDSIRAVVRKCPDFRGSVFVSTRRKR